jgi:hypothetical protein
MHGAKKPRSHRNVVLPEREIYVGAAVLPSKFLSAVRRWFDTAEPGADLTIKIAAGQDEHGFAGVIMCADAEAIHETLYTILSSEAAKQLADRLEQRLPRAIQDPERLDVYSGIALALREATKTLTAH